MIRVPDRCTGPGAGAPYRGGVLLDSGGAGTRPAARATPVIAPSRAATDELDGRPAGSGDRHSAISALSSAGTGVR
jgi:hypothetical protein